MTADEETYVHYTECIYSLNRAWSILCDLRAIERKVSIHAAAFRFALIEYAKPYTRSYGVFRCKRDGYILPSPNVAADLLTLHRQILDLRNTFLAHTDLTIKEAAVCVALIHGHKHVTVGCNIDPALPAIEDVISLIERTLDLMYVEFERLKTNLQPTA